MTRVSAIVLTALGVAGCNSLPSHPTCTAPDLAPLSSAKRVFHVNALPPSAQIIECQVIDAIIADVGDHAEVCALRIDPREFPQLLVNRTYAEKPHTIRSGLVYTLKLDPQFPITTRYYLQNWSHPGHMVYTNADHSYVVGYQTDTWCFLGPESVE